jgi:hypothetical protein
MSSLEIPLDGIVSTHSYPVRQRAILTLGFGQRPLGAERLLTWLHEKPTEQYGNQVRTIITKWLQ